MKNLTTPLMCVVFLSCAISCNEETEPSNVKSLLVGDWNQYEVGSRKTGFVPGISSGLTLVYESGIFFTNTGEFGPRYYDYHDGVWTEGHNRIGTYEIKGNGTILLVFSPGTADEYKLELRIHKLDEEHLWFEHSFYTNEQNPEPSEYHLERVK